MKMKHLGTALTLAGLLAGTAPSALAANAIKGKTSGHCQLTNVSYGRDLYNGSCKIKETINGSKIVFDIKMPAAESFLFATNDGGKTWMHGPEEVRLKDRGHSAVFRWGSFRLEVEED